MINDAFTAFVFNLGGDDVILGFMGIVLSFVIVISVIDYIID